MTDDPADRETDLQSVLDALDDSDCRAILRTLDAPMTARELMDELGLSQTTTYRKLDRLDEAGLLDEETEIRDDGHHATRYERAFAGVAVWLTGEDSFEVTTIRPEASADERLATFWKTISDEL